MKILVATRETQGQRKNDFCHATEGEIVVPSWDCDNEPVDGSCGCRRALNGVTSGHATTTFKVVGMEMSKEGLEKIIADYHKSGGWGFSPTELKEIARDDAKYLMEIAEAFKVGAIVEKRGNKFQSRVIKAVGQLTESKIKLLGGELANKIMADREKGKHSKGYNVIEKNFLRPYSEVSRRIISYRALRYISILEAMGF